SVLSPWVGYGIKHFGKPFPSDNNRQVLAARPGAVYDYYEVPPPADLLQHPRVWIAGLLQQKLRLVARGIRDALWSSMLPGLLAGVLVVWGGRGTPSWSARALRYGLLGLVLIPAMILPSLLTGYGDIRY